MSFVSVATPKPVELVVEQIRRSIVDGAFRRDQKLPTERELTALFGVSRGVVREAIKTLNGMGLVESRQGSGIFVRNDPVPVISQALTFSVTVEDSSVQQLFEFRALLECHAAQTAAERGTDAQLATIMSWADESALAAAADDIARFSDADRQCHRAVSDASNNVYLVSVLRVVWQMQGDIVGLLSEPKLFMTNAGNTHRRLATAIVSRQGDAAAAIMRTHIQASGTGTREALIADRTRGREEDSPRTANE